MQEVAIRFSASAGIVVQISSTGLQFLSHCPKRKTRPIRGNLSPGDAVCRNEQLANRLKSSRKSASGSSRTQIVHKQSTRSSFGAELFYRERGVRYVCRDGQREFLRRG